jgi:hypothetical protein
MADSDFESPRRFIERVGDALLRSVALFVMGAVHWALEWCLRFIIPENMPPAKLWLEDISLVFFAAIYVYLLWDMFKVFVPWFQPKIYPGLESVQDED